MGLGDFFKEVGNVADAGLRGASSGIHAVSSGLNVVDRYINPFHAEAGSAHADVPDQGNFLGLGETPLGHAVSDHVINPTVENVSQKLVWLRNNALSQPLSTFILQAKRASGGPGVYFSANDWASAWHAANRISPLQAAELGSLNNPNDTQAADQANKAITSPLLYYKPGDAYLPPGFNDLPQDQQQDFLKKAGMPAVGNAYIEELRKSSSFYKYSTGLGDFALMWWADPAVLAGKALSGYRASRQVMRQPMTGWSAADINKIMDSSVMGKTQQFLWDNKDNPALLNNLTMARNSALGPRFGPLVGLLKSPDEVHDFLLVTLNDVSAIERLQSKNLMAGSRIEQDTSRLSRLGLSRTAYADNPNLSALINKHMDRLNQQINADEQLVTRYNQVLDHAGSMDQVNLSRWSFAKAQAATDAQASYRARAARGAKAGGLGHEASVQPLYFTRGNSTPVDLGFTKTRLFGAGDFFSTPVTLVRSFANSRPNGYVRLDDIDQASTAEVRGQIARIPGINSQTRLNMLNDYLKTGSEGDRLAVLNQIGATAAAKIAEKHGLEPEAGLEIFQKHLQTQRLATDSMKRYSAAWKVRPNDEFPAGIRVDEFADDGGKVVVHPPTVSRLANDHVLQDLDMMDKVLARHSSALSAIRTSRLGNPDWMLDAADYMTSIFKFTTLFRLGYIPRVAGDDLAGQSARLGAATMAMRAGWGVRNGATNLALWKARPMAAAQAAAAKEGADFAAEKMAELQAQIEPLRAQIAGRRAGGRANLTLAGRRLTAAQAKRAAMDPATTPAARVAAMDQLIAKHQLAVDRASRSMSTGVGAKNIKLQDLQAHYGWLEQQFAERKATMEQALKKAAAPRASQYNRRVHLGNGVYAPAAFEGKEGEYYQKLNGSDEALGQIFATNKQIIHGHLMRSFDHGGKVIRAADDEALHAQSWAHAINAQIMQDELSRLAVGGMSAQDMAKWLTTTAPGRAYRQRLGLKVATPEDIADGAKHEVDEFMPIPEIRQKAFEPDGVTPEFLKESTPMIQRPELHTGQTGAATRKYVRAMDGVMDHWYKFAASLPADRLSRHPLFNQLYQGHLIRLKNQLVKQGAYDTTAGGIEQMATTARRLALRDTKKLVFDIAHRSDVSAALRFISPFMSATTESFQRWGRIIADKPQVVGYASNFYNSGLGLGSMQDADGNHIDRNGYSYTIDPKTGKAVRRLVPKAERLIVGRMPKWLTGSTIGRNTIGAAFGIEPSSRNFKLSQNSMDLVTQGDPWFNPGVGPIVQVPVNMLVKDKPKAAELARQLQILPFGPQNGGPLGTGPAGEVASFFLPSTVKNFLTAFDTSDDRYQQVKLQIMQRAAFEHDQLGKPMPSAAKIAAMTRQYWLFSAASAFLQPMATQKADNYQFFRDQYNALRRQDPMTADDEFLKRYQESFFIFAQAQSRNLSGIPATNKAVALSRKYGDLIAANPELGALIVGPEGNGPFSPEAYSYQLNTPVTPGSAEMQRTKMSADEAMTENKKRLGWSKYVAMVNRLTADLHNRGLRSFSDKGAEDLRQEKSNYTNLYSQPLMPDGTPNQYYNDAWSKDYSTLDPLRYERLIPGLQAVARSPLADEPNRSDLRVLQQYLGGRQAVLQALGARAKAGGAKTLTAKDNADLATQWQQFVDGLIQSDTSFGDLHSRFLARDLGYDGSSQEA